MPATNILVSHMGTNHWKKYKIGKCHNFWRLDKLKSGRNGGSIMFEGRGCSIFAVPYIPRNPKHTLVSQVQPDNRMVSNYVYVGVMIITLIDMVQLHHDAIDYFVTRGGVYDGRGRDIQFIV